MDEAKNMISLAAFKRHGARILAQIQQSDQPQILTVNGKPEIVMISIDEWARIQDQIDQSATFVSIRKGLTQARAGQGIEADRFFDGLLNNG